MTTDPRPQAVRLPAARGERLPCLLLVSHPDDDAIFAGEFQRRTSLHRWTVVCVTHGPDSSRAAEMRRWQETLGTDPRRVLFLGHADDPRDRLRGRCSIDASAVAAQLRALRLRPALVVTHNSRGEYGHPHHRLTHRVAIAVHPEVPRLVFGHGLRRADVALPCTGKWPAVVEAYPSQRTVIEDFLREQETFVAWPRAAALEAARRLLG